MKPIIKYRGGKSKEIKNFLQFIPHDYDRYVEPFAGGAALYFYLEPQLALINKTTITAIILLILRSFQKGVVQ